MAIKEPLDVGIAIGDFQIHYINNAYQEYLNYVSKRSRIFVILIIDRGVTLEDPLSFESRVTMIREEYPNAITYKVNYSPNITAFSQEIDRAVQFLAEHKVTLYLTPENHDYCGELAHTNINLDICTHRALSMVAALKVEPDTQESRLGALWLGSNTAHQPSNIYCILKSHVTENVLMIRRVGSNYMELPTGNMIAGDGSFEEASKRIIESFGNNISTNHRYVSSDKNNIVVQSLYIGGSIHSQPDIEFVSWVKITEETLRSIEEKSRKYLKSLMKQSEIQNN